MNREQLTYLRRLFIAIILGLFATPLLRHSLSSIDQQMTDCQTVQCAVYHNHVNTTDVEMVGECASGMQLVFRNVKTDTSKIVAKTRHVEANSFAQFAAANKLLSNIGAHHIVQCRSCDYYVYTLRKLLI